MDAFIKIDDVEKYYGNSGNITKAIDRVSFEITKGEFVGIMGGSGSGKTSLLNILATVDNATAGHVFFEGRDITKLNEDERAEFRKNNLGFVFQNFNLLDTMTLQENIYMPLILNGKKDEDILEKTDKIMDILGIKEVGNKYPYQVSGGQQQRCACARALVNNSQLILADEPTGALDAQSSENLMDLFTEINEKFNTTVLMVTHDPFSASYCNRILFLKNGRISYEVYRGARKREDYLSAILDAQKI